MPGETINTGSNNEWSNAMNGIEMQSPDTNADAERLEDGEANVEQLDEQAEQLEKQLGEELDKINDSEKKDICDVALARRAALSKKPLFLYPKEQRERIMRGQQMILRDYGKIDHNIPLDMSNDKAIRMLAKQTIKDENGNEVNLLVNQCSNLMDKITTNASANSRRAINNYALKMSELAIDNNPDVSADFKETYDEVSKDPFLPEDPWKLARKAEEQLGINKEQ